jgi:hypothetical protein
MPVFISVTGNNIVCSGDLVRRTILCQFDTHLENPAARPFKPGYLASIIADRAAILSDLATIWRWGRLEPDLPHGQPATSFDQWARWVRDPLVALGCKDVIARHDELKERDPERQKIAAVFAKWWEKHQNAAITYAKVDASIHGIIDPKKQSRQLIVQFLDGLDNTRLGNFHFHIERHKWSPNKYKLERTKTAEPDEREPGDDRECDESDESDADEPATEAAPGDNLEPDEEERERGDDEPPPRCLQCGQADGEVLNIAIEGRVVPLHVACLSEYEQALNRELEPPRADPGNELTLTEIRPSSSTTACRFAIPYRIVCAQCGERDEALRPYRHGAAEPWIWLHPQCVRHYARQHGGG